MAVRNQAEPCIFCGELACTCGKPRKKVTKRPAARRVETVPLKDSFDITDTEQQSHKTRFKVKDSERDLNLVNALRVLRDIVHPSEYGEIDRVVNPGLPQELDKRATEWRVKNVQKPTSSTD